MGLFDGLRKLMGGDRPDPVGDARIADLVRALDDGDWRVRLEACNALRDLGPRAGAAVAALQARIEDVHGDVCLAAADALSHIEREL